MHCDLENEVQYMRYKPYLFYKICNCRKYFANGKIKNHIDIIKSEPSDINSIVAYKYRTVSCFHANYYFLSF